MGNTIDGARNGPDSHWLAAGGAILLADLKLFSTCIAEHGAPRSTYHLKPIRAEFGVPKHRI